MTIHIASMMPDRALDESVIAKAITKIAVDLARFRDEPIQKRTPILDLIFLLPSRQERADFEGLRLHSFDKTSQTLRIECAVPEKMVASTHAERFVVAVIMDTIDAAAEFFTEQRILFNAAGHLALAEALVVREHYAIN
ncbi:hypothetical protein QLH52_08135 [Methylomonas sp. OY6]|uniref:Uncharacterized protein n=1 Tax=Methylomonas defluvii TaxID=3045149 RepID=A0ABU4UES7_9GAMM|nr:MULTISPECIES: hypothetical protein [unclassified Methylomonas]MDX8127244.1 hypothetical protein [Methylomonas sp. OY6]